MTTRSFKLLLLGVALSGFAAGPALADSYSYSYANSADGAAAHNWAGTYVGGFGGGNWSDFSSRAGSDSSFLYGGDVGHNWQYDRMIVGLEGDFSKFNDHVGAGGTKFTEDWSSSLRARAGYSVDRFLPYLTGGLAMTDTVDKVSGVGSDDRVQPGYVAGAGTDIALMDNWFTRVEYLHTDVPGSSKVIGPTTVDEGSSNNALRVGLNYKF